MIGDRLTTTASETTERDDTNYGFTWTEVEGQYRLRSPDGKFKEVSGVVVETLKARASEWSIEELIADVAAQRAEAAAILREMHEEGFVRENAPIRRVDPPPDVGLWHQGLVAVVLLAVGAFAWIETASSLAGPILADPLAYAPDAVLVATPIALLSLVPHEYGHYWIARRQGLEPSIGLDVVNGVFPVIVTRTDDGWLLPTNRRVLISLAGPIVGLTIACVLFALYHTVAPITGLGLAGIGVYNLQIVALLPLIHGDGYYVLTDLLGEENLRTRGIADLRDRELSGPALYVVASYGFVAVGMVAQVVVGYLVGDTVGAAFAFTLLVVAGVIQLWRR